MCLMKPNALEMEQRRDFASSCCQEDGMAAAQVPGLRLQCLESLSFWLSCSSPLHMGGSCWTGRVQGPRQLWGPLDEKCKTTVSLCPVSRSSVPCPHKATTHWDGGSACIGGGVAVPKDGAELEREGRGGAVMAEISGSHWSSQTSDLHNNHHHHRR